MVASKVDYLENENGVSILGGPGTGKSKIIRNIIRNLVEEDILIIDTGNHADHYIGYPYIKHDEDIDLIITELLVETDKIPLVVVEGLDKLFKEKNEVAKRLRQLVYIGEIKLISSSMEMTDEVVDVINSISSLIVIENEYVDERIIESKVGEIPEGKVYLSKQFRDHEIVELN